ncbi:unnamed protein product [Cylindrotheca closterium]|uniref:protein-histidine N-methyltransferase n=1 Tax=Cylindrotheca closterium TaxID=2856 RepID=A0AAD2FUU7_9STRA|nr:unnamed protein product [Cylindrotheca closterium]
MKGAAFTFDFLAQKEGAANNGPSNPLTGQNGADSAVPKETVKSFAWVENIESRILNAFDSGWALYQYEEVPLSGEAYVRSVRESISSRKELQGTDLVPGIYEGGLKVWECSIDLCRYLVENDIDIEGHVLELGCGQGLPGCCMLKRIAERLSSGDQEKTSLVGGTAPFGVVFSDYNEFVLTDVTIPNIALNVRDSLERTRLQSLSQYVTMGFGDWNAMSEQLLSKSSACPPNIPQDGLFDMILAAETTYSSQAASDTAFLLAKHLKVNTGVAFIATKRYYFGVGGGSGSFNAALSSVSLPNVEFNVETLMVFDNGAGNIRELLKVHATAV